MKNKMPYSNLFQLKAPRVGAQPCIAKCKTGYSSMQYSSWLDIKFPFLTGSQRTDEGNAWGADEVSRKLHPKGGRPPR